MDSPRWKIQEVLVLSQACRGVTTQMARRRRGDGSFTLIGPRGRNAKGRQSVAQHRHAGHDRHRDQNAEPTLLRGIIEKRILVRHTFLHWL
jgi:hypothetical protein